MILICGFLLLYPPTAHSFRIEWFVAAQIFCYTVAATGSYLILRRLTGIKLSFTFHGPTLLKIIKESLPYAALIFQMSIYNRADVTLMERICTDGKEQADVWSAAFRLMDQANMFGLMFATILLPMFGRMLAEKQDVQPIVKLCVNMLLPLSFMVAVAGMYFSTDIMSLLYHKSPTNPEYSAVFAILIASFPAWCLMYVYSTLLTAKGSLKTLNIIAFAGVVFNLSLNLYLIPEHKAIGAAITSLATQSGLAVAFIIFAARIIKLPFTPRWIAAQLGYLLLLVGLAQGLTTVMKGSFWVTQLLTFGSICMVLMFVFRFVSVGAIKQLMNRGGN
jgi:O-antigen/teichoic acid export membrane protein